MDFITYLVTKIILIKSKMGVFFNSRSKFTKKCNFFEIFVVIYNRYYRAI